MQRYEGSREEWERKEGRAVGARGRVRAEEQENKEEMETKAKVWKGIERMREATKKGGRRERKE